MTNKQLIDYLLSQPANATGLKGDWKYVKLGRSCEGNVFDPDLDDLWEFFLKPRIEEFLEFKSVIRERYGLPRLFPPNRYFKTGEIRNVRLYKRKSAKIMQVEVLGEKGGCRFCYNENIKLSEFCNQDIFLKEYSKQLRSTRLAKIEKEIEEAKKVVDQLERLYDRMKKEEGD